MSNIEAIKARAKFYKKGSVVPRNIASVSKKKFQHLLKFGTDTWALPGKNGWVCIIFHSEEIPAVGVTATRKMCRHRVTIQGSPNFPGRGSTVFVGNINSTPEQHYAAAIEMLGR